MKPDRNLVLVVANADPLAAQRQLTRPPVGIDAFELRIDRLAPEARTAGRVAELVAASTLPVVATCRPTDESGFFEGPDAARWELLSAAHQAGAALIDVEWSRLREDRAMANRWPSEQLLVSHHAASGANHVLEDELLAMTGIKAAGIKLVANATGFADSMRLVEMTRHLARSGRRATCFSSGRASLAGRVLGYLAGAWLTYLVPDGDDPPGPGIPNVSMLLDLYRLPAQGDSVKLLGLAGWPLDHSLSPRMQNNVIRVLGERYIYLPFESESIAEVIDFVRHHDVRGLSVTRPHKESVVPLLDGLDATARQAGAVNTVVKEGPRLIGWNTDLLAMRSILGEWGAGTLDRAVVIGAGGAARAVVAALVERDVPVLILNRDAMRGRALADECHAEYGGEPSALGTHRGTILVQATPLGSGGEILQVPGGFGGVRAVLDLAYRPGGTSLEISARDAGLAVISGHDFLARQGAAQFALWTRRLVDPGLFRDALSEETATREAAC
ncbi:MAG: type I 3-dehydroquinate dehydratase [Candidatus Eisenbacteria bacterium]|nr:type I 3-dehydroquinate dehydratase [Candidatus Eisenbacteria bacterium]